MTDISIVIPIQNEALNLLPLLEETRSHLSVYPAAEIICVDDGSTDQTPEILQQAAGIFPELRIIRLDECSGQSPGLLAGIQAAGFPVIVTMDGDGQNDPADIPHLVGQLLAQKKLHPRPLMNGYRVRRQDSPWRTASSKMANIIRSRFLGDDTPDSGCGIKAFLREDFLISPRFNHMHRFLPALFRYSGGIVFSVTVNHRPHQHDHSHYGTMDRLTAGIVDLLGWSCL